MNIFWVICPELVCGCLVIRLQTPPVSFLLFCLQGVAFIPMLTMPVLSSRVKLGRKEGRLFPFKENTQKAHTLLLAHRPEISQIRALLAAREAGSSAQSSLIQFLPWAVIGPVKNPSSLNQRDKLKALCLVGDHLCLEITSFSDIPDDKSLEIINRMGVGQVN